MNLEELHESGVSEHTGFPNAATDRSLSSLDLAKLLVRHPISTFFMRIRGSEGEEQGIYDGDIVVVDRAYKPRPHDRVIWWQDETFRLTTVAKLPAKIVPWGVVTYVIHELRPQRGAND